MAVGQRICFTCNCHRQTICAFTKTNKHLNVKKTKLYKNNIKTTSFTPKKNLQVCLGGCIYLVSTTKKNVFSPPFFPAAARIPHLQLSGRRHRSLNGFHGSGRPRISWDDGGEGPKGGKTLEDSTDLEVYKRFVNA